MNQRAPRPIYMVSALILMAVALGLALAPAWQTPIAMAQEGGADEETPAPTPTPVGCGECHIDIQEEWESSAHARAFTDSEFQHRLQDMTDPAGCYPCHTTGYQPATGEYLAENVTCEACHGVTPADHPPAPVEVDDSSELCGECHEVTYREWADSAHAAEGVQCVSCHTSHGRSLRFTNSQETCLSCHEERMNDYAHMSHINANLACVDCHIYKDPDAPIPVTGLAATSHEFRVPTRGCLRCHELMELEGMEGTIEPPTPTGDEAELRIAELEAQLAALEGSQEASSLQMVQGGVIGLVVGLVASWLLFRAGGRRGKGDRKSKGK